MILGHIYKYDMHMYFFVYKWYVDINAKYSQNLILNMPEKKIIHTNIRLII